MDCRCMYVHTCKTIIILFLIVCLLESYTWIPTVLGKGQGSYDPVSAAALQFKVCITEDSEKQDKQRQATGSILITTVIGSSIVIIG